MPLGDPIGGVRVGRVHLLARKSQQLPLVLSGDRRALERDQTLGRLGAPERTGEDVAEVDGDIGAILADIREHRLEGGGLPRISEMAAMRSAI